MESLRFSNFAAVKIIYLTRLYAALCSQGQGQGLGQGQGMMPQGQLAREQHPTPLGLVMYMKHMVRTTKPLVPGTLVPASCCHFAKTRFLHFNLRLEIKLNKILLSQSSQIHTSYEQNVNVYITKWIFHQFTPFPYAQIQSLIKGQSNVSIKILARNCRSSVYKLCYDKEQKF